jgi:hypothetical protein
MNEKMTVSLKQSGKGFGFYKTTLVYAAKGVSAIPGFLPE